MSTRRQTISCLCRYFQIVLMSMSYSTYLQIQQYIDTIDEKNNSIGHL
jgi:hypothetical protein